VIAPDRPGLPFVNADRIASVRFPGQELEQAYAAAEIAAAARDALVDARLDFGADGPSEVASFRYGLADHLPRWPDWVPEPLLAL
jgi:hypothetical protein